MEYLRQVWDQFAWLSNQNFFKPILDIITIVILAYTAKVTSSAALNQRRGNELSVLPVLIINIRQPQRLGDREATLTNTGKGFAYDIQITDWILTFTDMQNRYFCKLKPRNANMIEPGKTITLEMEARSAIEGDSLSDFLLFSMENTGRIVVIYYRSQLGIKYFMRLKVHLRGTDIITPPTQLNWWQWINIEGGLLVERWAIHSWWWVVWKFRKPYLEVDTSFRWWKIWKYFRRTTIS